MEYLSSPDSYLFKTAMMDGHGRLATPRRSVICWDGSMRSRQHPALTGNRSEQRRFPRHPHRALSCPYGPGPPRAEACHGCCRRPALCRGEVLIHGDVSPKNIIIHDGWPYILDAECATMGDAGFDAAFCLNHFILKSLHVRPRSKDYLEFCNSFWKSYSRSVDWESLDGLEARVALLLPMLMLGRVDGKSPVEYLSEDNRDLVRRLATDLVSDPRPTISELLTVIRGELDQ